MGRSFVGKNSLRVLISFLWIKGFKFFQGQVFANDIEFFMKSIELVFPDIDQFYWIWILVMQSSISIIKVEGSRAYPSVALPKYVSKEIMALVVNLPFRICE